MECKECKLGNKYSVQFYPLPFYVMPCLFMIGAFNDNCNFTHQIFRLKALTKNKLHGVEHYTQNTVWHIQKVLLAK